MLVFEKYIIKYSYLLCCARCGPHNSVVLCPPTSTYLSVSGEHLETSIPPGCSKLSLAMQMADLDFYSQGPENWTVYSQAIALPHGALRCLTCRGQWSLLLVRIALLIMLNEV